AKRETGELTPAALKEVEDEEINKIIKRQEGIGLQLATDGEFRRSWWHFDFFGLLDGVEVRAAEHGIQFKGVETKALALHVEGKIGFPATHAMLEHFRYLQAHTKLTPKMTIPSPSVLHFRLEAKAVNASAYAHRDEIFDDLAATYQNAIKAFYEAGCRYL